MAKKITELNPAAALDGTELAWVEQGGEPVKSTLQSIADLGGGGLAAGTVTDASLRWNGTAWVQNTNVLLDSVGKITIQQAGGGGERLILKDSDSTGNSVNNFIAFKDMNNTRQGWVGFGSSSNDDLSVSTDSGFGDIILNPQGSNALRISNTLITTTVGMNITGAITLSGDINALSYEGILGFNLIDKSDTSVLISGAWRFTDFDLLLSNNIALTSIDPGGPVRNLIKIAATTGEVLVGDALNPLEIRGTSILLDAPVTALSTVNILTAGDADSSFGLFEADLLRGFSMKYTGLTNVFSIRRHDSSAVGSAVMSMNRTNDAVTFAGAITATTFAGIPSSDLVNKSAVEIINNAWVFTATNVAPATQQSKLSRDMLYLDGKEALDGSDTWLRLNQNGDFSSGTFSPNLIRTDFGFRVGSAGATFRVESSFFTYKLLGILRYQTAGFTQGRISVQTTAPTSPLKGDIWFDTS